MRRESRFSAVKKAGGRRMEFSPPTSVELIVSRISPLVSEL